MFVDISAKQNLHVDKLLEAVLLTADAELDLRANPDMDARGATVEADSTRVVVPWPLCWFSRVRSRAMPSWPALRTAACVPCSTRTVSRWKRPVRPHLFRCWA